MKRRNEYARKLAELKERMRVPGYVVMTTDLELLSELIVDLTVKYKREG